MMENIPTLMTFLIACRFNGSKVGLHNLKCGPGKYVFGFAHLEEDTEKNNFI